MDRRLHGFALIAEGPRKRDAPSAKCEIASPLCSSQ